MYNFFFSCRLQEQLLDIKKLNINLFFLFEAVTILNYDTVVADGWLNGLYTSGLWVGKHENEH